MDSAYHYAEAEHTLAHLAAMARPDAKPEDIASPETCELWLRAATVHVQLAAVALEAEKTLGMVIREPWMFALGAPTGDTHVAAKQVA
jgi:hypothetical protein